MSGSSPSGRKMRSASRMPRSASGPRGSRTIGLSGRAVAPEAVGRAAGVLEAAGDVPGLGAAADPGVVEGPLTDKQEVIVGATTSPRPATAAPPGPRL